MISDWNEDNFLERLTPQLRQECGGATGPCPDAETLCAVIEGVARGPERDAVMEHLSQCAACAELRNRLLNFDNLESVSPPEAEAVWKQTRIRLDNWLEGFLRSEAAHMRSPKVNEPSWRAFVWESFSNFITSGKALRAVGVAVVLVLIVDGILLLEYRRAQLPKVQVAARATVPPKPPANPALPSAPPDHNLRTETAQAKVPPPPNPTPRRVPLPKASKGGSRVSAGPGGLAAPDAESPQAEQQPPPRNGASPPDISHAPALRLEPASRVLIVLSSISPRPDGSFQFHGILLLPVAQPGPVPLDLGAEVIGVGTRSQGQTSLAVTELDVHGVRYILKEGSGVMNAQAPGAAGGVHFDPNRLLDMWPTATGQVLDMQPTATAVYEKVSDQTGQPDSQK